MEFIYVIMIFFAGGDLHSIQIHPWHIYADETGVAEDLSCEAGITDAKFQAHMAANLKTGQKVSLQCKAHSEMRGLNVLLRQAPVTIEASEASNKNKAPRDGEVYELSGKLVHVPYESGRKSTAAYLGQEFFLETEQGRVALYAGDAISRKALLKKVGQKVRLRGQFSDRTPKGEELQQMSYPTDMDGGPMKRVGYVVLEFLK